jgi:hypothetical protein
MLDVRSSLSDKEIKIVVECLRATVEGEFFPDWEFETLLGVSRETVRTVYKQWPNLSLDDESAAAVIGSLNNLLGYPHRQEHRWADYISVSPQEVRALLERLLELGL